MLEEITILKEFLKGFFPTHVVQTVIIGLFAIGIIVFLLPYLKKILEVVTVLYRRNRAIITIAEEFKNNGGSTLRDKIDSIYNKLENFEKSLALINGRTLTIMTIIGEGNEAPGLFETDVDGNCVFVTKKWTEMTGLTLEEAEGNGWINAIHPEDREKVFNAWKLSTQNYIKFDMCYRIVNNITDKVTKVRGYTVPVKDSEHYVVRYVGAIFPCDDERCGCK